MAIRSEPTTIGLSESSHRKLKRLKEDGYFGEMLDAYRFAIALALSQDEIAESAMRTTIFNVGTLDPDKSLYHAVSTLIDEKNEPVYRAVERLAEWGVQELFRMAEEGKLEISKLLKDAEVVLDKIS